MSTGNLSELLVIADDDWQRGIPGNLVRQYFGASFLGVQHTPVFDLHFVTPDEFLSSSEYKTQRNCLILLPQKSKNATLFQALKYRLTTAQKKTLQDSNVVAARNLWSDHQLSLFVTAEDPKHFTAIWQQYLPVLFQNLKNNDAYLLAQKIADDPHNTAVENLIRQRLNIALSIPEEFEVVQEKDSIIWIRRTLPQGGNCWLLLRTIGKTPWPTQSSETNLTFVTIMNKTPIPENFSKNRLLKIDESEVMNWQDALQPNDNNKFYFGGTWHALNEHQGSFHAQLVRAITGRGSLLMVSFIEGDGGLQREWLLTSELIFSKIKQAARP